MANKVSARLVASLEINKDGRTIFDPIEVGTVSHHLFAMGQLLFVTTTRRANPKAFMGTITLAW